MKNSPPPPFCRFFHKKEVAALVKVINSTSFSTWNLASQLLKFAAGWDVCKEVKKGVDLCPINSSSWDIFWNWNDSKGEGLRIHLVLDCSRYCWISNFSHDQIRTILEMTYNGSIQHIGGLFSSFIWHSKDFWRHICQHLGNDRKKCENIAHILNHISSRGA